MTEIQLLRPEMLWLLLPALAVFVLPRRSRPFHAVVRYLVLALLIVAIARPVMTTDRTEAHHVVIVDASSSMQNTGVDSAMAVLDAIGTDASVDLVWIGDDQVEPSLGVRANHVHVIADHASPLGHALTLAGVLIPTGSAGAVTVVSDARQTDASFGDAVAGLTARAIPVHSVAVRTRGTTSRIVSIEPVGEVRVGHTAQLRVRVEAGEQFKSPTVRVVLSDQTERLGESEIPFLDSGVDGANPIAEGLIEFEPTQAGFLACQALAAAEGETNSTTPTLLAVQSPISILYLGGRVQNGSDAITKMLGAGFALNVVPPGAMPDETALRSADVIWIDDCPAERVTRDVQEQIATAVRDRGAGLIMSGGNGAFGPGGWHDTAIADVLPVDLVQKEEKRDPSVALAVIIDTSGSMSGNRVQLAKEVARLAIRRLLPHDKVGIVEFYGAKRWAAPIQPASNSIELERALNRLDAGGGTVILPAIEEAFYGLQNVQARYKHVLILTDGGVEQGAFEPLLRRMADEGMTVSTVLVGGDLHSEFLVTIANWGKGRFYSVPNRFNLPEVIFKQPASARLPAYRSGSFGIRTRFSRGWWGGVDPGNNNMVDGYVETQAKDGAQILLEIADGEHPVMATWNYGAGRVTTLMTEPAGPGTASWRDWPGFGAMLARVVSRTAEDSPRSFAFALTRRDHIVQLTATRTARNTDLPVARAVDTDEAWIFEPRTPDIFVARRVVNPQADLRLEAWADNKPEQITRLASHGASMDDELRVDPNVAIIPARLAQATGGRTWKSGEQLSGGISVGGGQLPVGVASLWPWCYIAALVLFLGEICWRRLP